MGRLYILGHAPLLSKSSWALKSIERMNLTGEVEPGSFDLPDRRVLFVSEVSHKKDLIVSHSLFFLSFSFYSQLHFEWISTDK